MNAHVSSTDEGVDPPIGLPKAYTSMYKVDEPGRGNIDTNRLGAAFLAGGTSLALTYAGTRIGSRLGKSGGFTSAAGGMAGGAAGGIGGGFTNQAITDFVNRVNPQVRLGDYVENSVVQTVENGEKKYYVMSNTDSWQINFGPPYEVIAEKKIGYVPDLDFCKYVNTTALLCSHQFILRDTINDYQADYEAKNPGKGIRVKTLYTVEPRGKDGCYYKWSTTNYDPTTNVEGTTVNVEEVVRKYVIKDKATCVWTPTNEFVTDISGYPLRQYFDSVKNEMVFPTKVTTYVSNYSGRWIKILPSTTADNFVEIAQIAVYDVAGENIAFKKQCYASSEYTGPDGTPGLVNKITNGIIAAVPSI